MVRWNEWLDAHIRQCSLAQQGPKNLVEPYLVKVLEKASVCCVLSICAGSYGLTEVVGKELPLLLRRVRDCHEGKEAHVNAMKARRAKLFILVLLFPDGPKFREDLDQLSEQVVLVIGTHAVQRLI
ncbi:MULTISPECIES: hypothetical protein [unclassified Rhizobacter]|uniref:hypothetical protein n=1 Tax=unclassified Rhizobacter TaxID=2640088 RepID=UPI0012F9906C|nr:MULTISPECIES: hypothetical protein [unclassified Rhizobacter]